MGKPADLIAYVFSEQAHPISGELLRWMEASPRFTAFVETYRDKIRKKVRVAGDLEGALDLRSELDTARRLLEDRRLAVQYEPYLHERRRGADFAVTYRANLTFNIEVARIRAEENGAGEVDAAKKEERILRILLDKLGQMQAGMANLLVIETPEAVARVINLDGLMQGIKLRAEMKEAEFYALSRYSGPAAFYRNFLRLSGVALRASGGQVWANKQARPGLDEKILRLVGTLLGGAG
jgi:hypothetical protein